ncbi:MAG: protein-disulfide reductase DsbD domain-containing protein [Terriglobia bacterium]
MKPALTATLSLMLLALVVPQGGTAQGILPRPEAVVSLCAQPAKLALAPGSTATVKLTVDIMPGFHINSNQPLQEYLIPTEVFLPAPTGPAVPKLRDEFELTGVSYPKAELKSFGFAPGEKLAVYEGRVEIAVRLRARPAAQPGQRKLALGLRYQACNDQICLRPAKRQLTLSIEIRPKTSPGQRPGS